jgi:hypothetical protein
MATKKGRAWKMERASVTTRKGTRSNKYSGGDSSKKPAPGTRTRFWVGGHDRGGSYVRGHYRKAR